MNARRISRVVLLLVCGVMWSCTSLIGDDCETSRQCPVGSFCDRTMPGGYCTRTPCRPGECPEEAVCVEFDNGQTFCMLSCDASDDCRDDYTCITTIGPWPFCSVE